MIEADPGTLRQLVDKAIQQIAADEKFDLIIQEPVIYASPRIDITDKVIKALEEKLGGYYTPSAGTVYPTLQLLEDEGYVRADDSDGKKVYHVTPEGERYLEENRGLLDDILDRVRETVRDFTGGGIGELQGAFVHLAGVTFKRAWRKGPDDPALKRVAEILRKAAGDIEETWGGGPQGSEAGSREAGGGQAS